MADGRGFATFLVGHALSTVGGRMQAAALLWHVYAQTGSAFALGGLAAAELAPTLGLAVVAGVAADRYDRRALLAVSQAAQAVPALVLAGATWGGADHFGVLYGAAAAGAVGQAFDTAARKALVPRLVAPARLASAVSSIDLVKNVGKLLGPALMGLSAATIGLAPIYLVNALSFAAMLAALARVPASAPSGLPAGWVAPLGEGIRFVRAAPVVGALIWLDFVATLFAGAEVLLPAVADRVLGVGPAGYGVLASATAAGALLAGGWLAAKPPRRRVGALAIGAAVAFGVATVAFGVAHDLAACVAALVAVGAADTVSTVLRNTLLQLRTPDGLRGRVTAVSALFTKSGPRLGQLEAGLVAGWFGLQASIVSGGALCVAAAIAVAWWSPALRAVDRPEG